MDMAKLLQKLDSVAAKPVVDANSMKKFLQVVTEAKSPHKVSLPVQMAMQHYQTPKEETPHVFKPVGRETTLGKYFHKVESEIAEQHVQKRNLINQYATVIAERVMMKEAANPAQQAAIAIAKKKKKGVAEGSGEAEAYKAHLIKTMPQMMNFLSKKVKGWTPGKEEMLGAIDTAYMVMKHTGDVKQAGKAMMDELNTLHRMSQGQQGVAEGEIPGHSMGFKPGAGSPGVMPNEGMSAQVKLSRAWDREQAKSTASAERAQKAKAEFEKEWKEKQEKQSQEKNPIKEANKLARLTKEAVLAPIKPNKPKAIKPKAKTSVCRAGQTQTGMQTKNGMSVPKCSVK